MSHYFDDILHRHERQASVPRLKHPGNLRLRRSSTSRSIGNRSDFGIDHDQLVDYRSPVEATFPSGAGVFPPLGGGEQSYSNHGRADADTHLNRYVTEQLEHLRQEHGVGDQEESEIECSP